MAFRRLCRTYGAGLYVCEMITSRALVERDAATLHMITFDGDEYPRSMQIYGVDPETIGDAVRMIVEEDLADHVDMNVCRARTAPIRSCESNSGRSTTLATWSAGPLMYRHGAC